MLSKGLSESERVYGKVALIGDDNGLRKSIWLDVSLRLGPNLQCPGRLRHPESMAACSVTEAIALACALVAAEMVAEEV